MEETNSGYSLSRAYWDWSYENPEKVRPIHAAIFFFAIEHCNRLGWKKKFGFPSQMVMDAIGIKNGRTYRNALDDLEEFGFITFIERSKNQYSSNIIALSKNDLAPYKALDKALLKHHTKHHTKQVRSIAPIDKPYKPLNKEPLNHKPINKGFDVFEEKPERTIHEEVFSLWAKFSKKELGTIPISSFTDQQKFNELIDKLDRDEENVTELFKLVFDNYENWPEWNKVNSIDLRSFTNKFYSIFKHLKDGGKQSFTTKTASHFATTDPNWKNA